MISIPSQSIRAGQMSQLAERNHQQSSIANPPSTRMKVQDNNFIQLIMLDLIYFYSQISILMFFYFILQDKMSSLYLLSYIIIKEITTMINPQLVQQIEYYLSEENLQND